MGCCASTPVNDVAGSGADTPLPCAILPTERRIARNALPLLRQPHTRVTLPLARERIRKALGGAARVPSGSYTVIPHALRWWAYQHLSGGAELEASCPGLYRLLLRLGPSATQDLTIRFDAHRTFPYMPFFGTAARPGPGQSQLYRVAVAYSHLDPAIGYTQGCNFLIALLLLAGLSEEAAFYAFAGLMLRLRLRLFYGHGLPLAMTALTALDSLLRTRAPHLHAHLEAQSVLPVLYATPWILSFWVSSPLPASTLLCLLDILLLEAPPLSPGLPPLVGRAYATALEAECERSRSMVGTVAEAGAALTPAAPPPPASEPVTVLDLPPVYLRVCLALVLVHADELLAADDTDGVYAVIKDEYAPLPLRPHRRSSNASDDAVAAAASRRRRGSTAESAISGVPKISADAAVVESTPAVLSPAPIRAGADGLRSPPHSRRGGDRQGALVSETDGVGGGGALTHERKPLASVTSLADGSIAGHEVAALPPFVPALAPDPAVRGDACVSSAVNEERSAADVPRSASRAEPTGAAAAERSACQRSLSAGSVIDAGRRRSATATRRPFPTITVAFRALSASATAAAAVAKRAAPASPPRGKGRRRWSLNDLLSRSGTSQLLAEERSPSASPGPVVSTRSPSHAEALLLPGDPPWASAGVRRHSDPTGTMSPGCNRTASLMSPSRPLPVGFALTGAGGRARLAPLPPALSVCATPAAAAVSSTPGRAPSANLPSSGTSPVPIMPATVEMARSACESAPAALRSVDALRARSVSHVPLGAASAALLSTGTAPPRHHVHARKHWQFSFGGVQLPASTGVVGSPPGSGIDNGLMREDGGGKDPGASGGGRHRRTVSRLPSAPMLKPPVGVQRQAAPTFALRPEASMRDFGSASLQLPPQQHRRGRGGGQLGSPSTALAGRATSAESPAGQSREGAPVLTTPSGRGLQSPGAAGSPALGASAASGAAATKSASASPPSLLQALASGGVALLAGGVHAPRRLAVFEPSDGCSLADWMRDAARNAAESVPATPQLEPSAAVAPIAGLPQPQLVLAGGRVEEVLAATTPEARFVASAPRAAPPSSRAGFPSVPSLASPVPSAAPTHASSLVHAVAESRSGEGGGGDSSEEESLAGGARVAPSVSTSARFPVYPAQGPPRGPERAWPVRGGEGGAESDDAAVPRTRSFSAVPTSRSTLVPSVGMAGSGTGSFHIHVSGRGGGGGAAAASARSRSRGASPTPHTDAPLLAPSLRPLSGRGASAAGVHSSDLPTTPGMRASTPSCAAFPLPGAALSPKAGGEPELPPAPHALTRRGGLDGVDSRPRPSDPQAPVQAPGQSFAAIPPRGALLLVEDGDSPRPPSGNATASRGGDRAFPPAAPPAGLPADLMSTSHRIGSIPTAVSRSPGATGASIASPGLQIASEIAPHDATRAGSSGTVGVGDGGVSGPSGSVTESTTVLRTSQWVCDGKPCSEWALPRLFLARLQGRDVAIRPSDMKSLLTTR